MWQTECLSLSFCVFSVCSFNLFSLFSPSIQQRPHPVFPNQEKKKREGWGEEKKKHILLSGFIFLLLLSFQKRSRRPRISLLSISLFSFFLVFFCLVESVAHTSLTYNIYILAQTPKSSTNRHKRNKNTRQKRQRIMTGSEQEMKNIIQEEKKNSTWTTCNLCCLIYLTIQI